MHDQTPVMLAPSLPSPWALGRALRRSPPRPTMLARSLRGGAGVAEFRAIVDLVFPADADALMAADQPPLNRAAARVDAFLFRVAHELFEVYEPNFDDGYWEGAEYLQVTRGIPFVRFGWTMEEQHELDVRPGYLLLMALCADPDGDASPADWSLDDEKDDGWRVALLDWLATSLGIPADTLARLPRRGVDPGELRRRLGGGRFAAAADFALWFRARTELTCLDLSEDDDYPVPWTRHNVDVLAGEWPRAHALLERVGELAAWLEDKPTDHFAVLLDALLADGTIHEPHPDEVEDGAPTPGTIAITLDDDDPAPVPPIEDAPADGDAGHHGTIA